MSNVIPLGLGSRPSDPVTVLPLTSVIEVTPAVAATLDPTGTIAERVRWAIAAQAGVDLGDIELPGVEPTPHGALLVSIERDSAADRALAVAARRRATNPAEALHAALLALD